MIQTRNIKINDILYPVVISDSQMTLLAAQEAGRVIVGYLHPDGDQNLSPAGYLVESLDVADDRYLERVVRRQINLPWLIAETERLIIREFCPADLPRIIAEAGDDSSDRIFTNPDTLNAYIRTQYRYYEYGIWAVIRKSDGILIGKAGVCDCDTRLELGYHIFGPYRNHGYATESCHAILTYVKEELDGPVYARTEATNRASAQVLNKLGFILLDETHNPQMQGWCQYVWNC